MHSYHSYVFVFFWTSLYLVNKSGHFVFETNEPNPGMYVGCRSYDPVECLAKVMQSEIYPRFFANSFGTLDHFKADCKAEELT